MINKKESEDQAHVYVPAARKPKFEEPPRRLGEGSSEISLSVDTEDLIKTKHVNNEQEPMDIKSDDTDVKTEPINMSTLQNNIDNNSQTVNDKKKPTLTNEDLDNFKSSISYVSFQTCYYFH